MRLHGRNAAQWWRHEKSEDRYDYLYSADELKEFSETADAAQAAGEEALSLHEQSLLGEVGRQRRDDQAAARRAARRRVLRRSLIERYPELAGVGRIIGSSLPHGHLPDEVAALEPRRHVVAVDDVAEHGVLAVQVRAIRERHVDLAVGAAPGCPDGTSPTAPRVCRRFCRDLRGADRMPARRRRRRGPTRLRCDRSRDRGSPHCTRNPGSARCTRWPS